MVAGEGASADADTSDDFVVGADASEDRHHVVEIAVAGKNVSAAVVHFEERIEERSGEYPILQPPADHEPSVEDVGALTQREYQPATPVHREGLAWTETLTRQPEGHREKQDAEESEIGGPQLAPGRLIRGRMPHRFGHNRKS